MIKMDVVTFLIFLFGFNAVTAKDDTKELGSRFPVNSPISQKIGQFDSKEDEKFLEVTESAHHIIDGNHPDTTKVTHDHIDESIGGVTPSKRVKKILPPFKIRKQRNTDRKNSQKYITHPNVIKVKEKNKRNILNKNKAESTSETPVVVNENKGETMYPEEAVTNSNNGAMIEEREIRIPDFLLPEQETITDKSFTTPFQDEEIHGIRLVPETFGKDESEEEEKEEVTMQKSIWDLLKQREQSNGDEGHLDDLGTSEKRNESEIANPSTEKPATPKSLFEHFDSDSAEMEFQMESFKRGYSNVEKHEFPLSYALSWLQVRGNELNIERNTIEKGKNESVPPKVEMSNLLENTQNANSEKDATFSIINSDDSDSGKFDHRPSKWFLLLLIGNSTIVQLRSEDFSKYLKLNLAARLSVEYDDVRVNKVMLAPPQVLVNVSVFAPSLDVAEDSQLDFIEKFSEKGDSSLYKLAETNATLLELSGEEYHVVRFLSLDSQKPEAEAHKGATGNFVTSRQGDLEFILYTFFGSISACALILTFFITMNKYIRRVSDYDWPWLRAKPSAWTVEEVADRVDDETDMMSPAVIYSGGFPRIRGSWMNGLGSRPFDQHQTTSSTKSITESVSHSESEKNSEIFQEPDDAQGVFRRQNKLEIFNCSAKSLVIPRQLQYKAIKGIKNKDSEIYPLDVRIGSLSKTGQNNSHP